MIVGMLRHARFRTTTLRLAPGDTLVLYTDGVTEAGGAEGQLGVARLQAVLADCRGMPAQAITERLEQLVLDFLAGRPHDDLALVAIRPSA
jgi:serine phosphatase RsbU (regulator of sigma subunit)